MAEYLNTDAGRRIAYEYLPGNGPGLVFLSGFKSDMDGTKAVHLRDWARARGQAFLRFDYSGHGASSGAFEDGAICDWAEDAAAVIDHATAGPQILVGSSMGGWISLILVPLLKENICGIVGIAAAPDFTEDAMWAGFSPQQRQELSENGQIELPSDYDAPYVITRRLIEDGRRHLVLKQPLNLPFPVRLLQGTEDNDVDRSRPLAILDHATGDDIRVTFVKGADHRFSSPDCLRLIEDTIGALTPA